MKMTTERKTGCVLPLLIFLFVILPIIILGSNFAYQLGFRGDESLGIIFLAILIGGYLSVGISDWINDSDDRYKKTINLFLIYFFTGVLFIGVTLYMEKDVPKWNTDEFRMNYMVVPMILSFFIVFAIKLIRSINLPVSPSKNRDDGFSLFSWFMNKILAPLIISLVLGGISYWLTGDFDTGTKVTIVSIPINFLIGSS